MDILLNYIEKGQGEPLILLHGNGENLGYFKYQVDFFSDKYRVIAVDTRGHGKSPRGSAPFTIRQFAADLNGFMDHLGIDKANVLGFSDGGNIALVFAILYPDRVLKLILNGANLNFKGLTLSVKLSIGINYFIFRVMSALSDKFKARAELLRLMVRDPDIAPKELRDVHNEVLVIAGTHDMIKDSHTRLIAGILPNSQLAIIPGDHFIAAKNYSEFNRIVLNFLIGSNKSASK